MNQQTNKKLSADSPLLLAIDSGTQSTRVLLFDINGQLIAKSQIALAPYQSPQPGWAEQDPEYFWASVCRACQQLWSSTDIDKSAIKAVSLCCQRGTVINLDDNGKPLRPAIAWLDQRQTDQLPELGLWKLLFGTVGVLKTVRHFQGQAEVNWIKHEQPEIWQKTHKMLFLSGYHSYRLTGNYIDSSACQVGYMPFDYRRQQWCKPHDWKWKALAIRPDMLPELVGPGDKMGTICPQAAIETGIPEGLPLIASAADKACELLGAGALSAGVGSISYGTSATFNIHHHRYRETIPAMPPYPAATPRAYNMEVMVNRGYWMVSWFKREFAQREQSLAAERGIATEVLFEDLLKSVPPGSMGLMLQPYWSPGVREPEPHAKGAIIGFGDVHTRAHIYRAIIEGLAYALREGKERVEIRSGVRVKKLRVSGGGSQSDEAMQITADVFGIAAERPHTFETSGLGAAINAAVGIGLYDDYAVATKAMVHTGKRFEPVNAHVKIYQQLYKEVYRRIYGRLDPLYRMIKKITGYPQ